LILDEADTLLDMGFRDDIEAIIDYLPKTPERQTFLFSATVSRSIQQIARATLDKNHMFVNTVTDNNSPVHTNIPQYHTVLPSAAEQIPHTLRLLAHDQLLNPGKSKAIIFLPTTKMTQLFATLIRELSKTVLPSAKRTKVYEIHSKRTQEARTTTSDSFRNDKSGASILVSSDVSARGVDYPGVSRVIQVGIPGSTDQYVHRVGRTGRAGTNGRGDLILLPWECGFVTWQLTDMPLKPLTISELKSQVSSLAAKYDEDPQSFFQGIKAATETSPHFDRGGRQKDSGPALYSTPVSQRINDMASSIGELLENIDEEAVKETFASLLGYYIAKSPELRTQKGVIVQGCKDWTMEACGLPVPPYVSDAFLHKLGFSDGRTKRFGSAIMPDKRSGGRGGASWMGRGMQRNKGQEREVPSWATSRDDIHEDDPVGRPEEYRSQRYGKTPREYDRDRAPRQYDSRQSEDRAPRQYDSSYGRQSREFGGDRSRDGGGDRDRGSNFGRMDRFGRRDAGESGYGMRR
jgi:ATP-dependent RNA helicase MSS116